MLRNFCDGVDILCFVCQQRSESCGWCHEALAVSTREERGRSAKRRLVELCCLRDVLYQGRTLFSLSFKVSTAE